MALPSRLIYEFDDFQLVPDERKLRRGGALIPLHGKAFEMLVVLIRNRGKLLTKDELFELVWPDQIVEESNLTVNMSAIRRALGERASSPRYITTVSGRGYRFSGDVRQFSDEALTIERESFTRLVVEQEEVETNTSIVPSAQQISNVVKRVTAHPLILLAMCSLVLVIAGVAVVSRSLRRTAAAALPWSNVTFRRFDTHGGVPFRVAISPDGKSLVYNQRINGSDSLWLGQIESNSSVQILNQENVTYNGLAFSPDGQSVYFTDYDTEKLFRIPAIGGVPTELIDKVDSAVTFSPDGGQLAFLRDTSEGEIITIADCNDGKTERSLSAIKPWSSFSTLGLSWSPDGKTIALAARNSLTDRIELVAVSISDGSIRKISDRDWGEIGNVKWQADGNGLLFTEKGGQSSRKSSIWFTPYPQGEPQQITHDLNQYFMHTLSLSSTDILATIDGKTGSEIWVAPAGDVSRARRVLQGIIPKYEGIDGLTWAPDGHLLYTAYVGDAQTIWEMNSDGSNRKQLTSNVAEFVDRQMAVSADNRHIIFQSNRAGSVQLWSANRDGSDLKQLTDGINNYQASLSPDSKWIVYVSGDGLGQTLWRIPIEGGLATQLSHNRSTNPQISPDGKYIAFLESSDSHPQVHVAIIPFSGGETIRTFELPQRPGPNLARRMRWTPDGKAIIYKDTMQGLWRQKLDEKTPQMVSGFENVQLSGLAWSFDGKTLAYTRSANMQEIVLLQGTK